MWILCIIKVGLSKNLVKKPKMYKRVRFGSLRHNVPKKAKKTVAVDNFKIHNNKLCVVILNPDTNKIIFSINSDLLIKPASLTKMMTLLIIFEQLDKSLITLEDKIYFSKRAAAEPRCKLGVPEGQYIFFKDAINSIVVSSSNDSSTAVAEKIAGSVENFAKKMNEKAKKIGMKYTNFMNANGLPNTYHFTTARDVAILASYIYKNFPHRLELFSLKSFSLGEKQFFSTNKTLGKIDSNIEIKGMKTGWISSSGYNLVSLANYKNKHLIIVAIGCKTATGRDNLIKKLSKIGFYVCSHFLESVN